MTTSALIDAVINYTDNVAATDADNSTRRARILQYAQEVVDEVWVHWEWPFRRRYTTVTISANGTAVDLPSDFHDFGKTGGAFLDSTGRRLREVTPEELVSAREVGGSGEPQMFSVYDINTTSGVKKFQVLQVGASTAVNLLYLATSPTLVDATDSTNKLFYIPASYHNTVILPGTVAKARMSLGDVRDFITQYRLGLHQMLISERPRKTVTSKMPLQNNQW